MSQSIIVMCIHILVMLQNAAEVMQLTCYHHPSNDYDPLLTTRILL